MNRIYDVTRTLGKMSVSQYTTEGWIEQAIERGDEAIVQAAIFKAIASEGMQIEGFFDVMERGYGMEGYIEFAELSRDVTGVIDPKTGKAKSGSKQKEIIKILDEMDISPEEKAYYYSTKYQSQKNNPWKAYLE